MRVIGRVIPVVVLVVLLLVVVFALLFGRASAQPEQPIAFSHKNHAVDRQIACLYCHRGADEGYVAGIPPLETCMGCHQNVGLANDRVAVLRAYYGNNQPVQWTRVTFLPDHTVFAHRPHVLVAGISCLDCHARGAPPERWFESFSPGMAWCTTCHAERGASTQCYTCHK